MFGITPLVPAYGRDYKSAREVALALNAGKDFVTASGQYANLESLESDLHGVKSINVRFSGLRKVTVIQLEHVGGSVRAKVPPERKPRAKVPLAPDSLASRKASRKKTIPG